MNTSDNNYVTNQEQDYQTDNSNKPNNSSRYDDMCSGMKGEITSPDTPSYSIRDTSSYGRKMPVSTYSKLTHGEKDSYRKRAINELSSYGSKSLVDYEQYAYTGYKVKGKKARKLSIGVLITLTRIEKVFAVKIFKSEVMMDIQLGGAYGSKSSNDIIDDLVGKKDKQEYKVAERCKRATEYMMSLNFTFDCLSFYSIPIVDLGMLRNLDKVRNLMMEYSYYPGRRSNKNDEETLKTFLRFFETYIKVNQDNIVYRLFRIAYIFLIMDNKINASIVFRFLLHQYNLVYGDGTLTTQDIIRNDPEYFNAVSYKQGQENKYNFYERNKHLKDISTNHSTTEPNRVERSNVYVTTNIHENDNTSNVNKEDKVLPTVYNKYSNVEYTNSRELEVKNNQDNNIPENNITEDIRSLHRQRPNDETNTVEVNNKGEQKLESSNNEENSSIGDRAWCNDTVKEDNSIDSNPRYTTSISNDNGYDVKEEKKEKDNNELNSLLDEYDSRRSKLEIRRDIAGKNGGRGNYDIELKELINLRNRIDTLNQKLGNLVDIETEDSIMMDLSLIDNSNSDYSSSSNLF